MEDHIAELKALAEAAKPDGDELAVDVAIHNLAMLGRMNGQHGVVKEILCGAGIPRLARIYAVLVRRDTAG